MSALSHFLGTDDLPDESVADRSLERKSLYQRICVGIAGCLYYSGVVPLLRRKTRQRTERQLIILSYHRASGNLRQHVRYLQRHYRILPLEPALSELYMPRDGVTQQKDRRLPVVLTFDDGYRDNYTAAFALARELKVPITLFLLPGYIDSANRFWWFEATYLAQHAAVHTAVIDGHTYHLTSAEERQALAHAIHTRIHHARSVAEREAYIASTREALGMSASSASSAASVAILARPLGWSEVREMDASGWVSHGAHTMNHPILSQLCDSGEVEREVRESRSELERRLGHAVHVFAYPSGAVEDIGDLGLDAVKKAGYRWALTTITGVNTPDTDPYMLRRIDADTGDHWWMLAWALATQVAGAWTSPSYLLRKAMRSGGRLLKSRKLTALPGAQAPGYTQVGG